MLISQISQSKKQLITNSLLELGDDITDGQKGKGRKFVSRFIEAGVAHYQDFGDVLITKETLDRFIHTMVGCPVIIQHKEITDKNADKERVGVVSNVFYSNSDGWYYCEGIIWNKQAIDLVKNQGWNVSCTYDFVSDNQEKTHNGKKIDMEFIDGNFLHLALVPNPRYERANIVINSKDIVNNWLKEDEISSWVTTESGARIPIKKGLSKKDGIRHFAEELKKEKKTRDKKKNEAYTILAQAIGKDINYIKRNFKSKKVQDLIQEAKTKDTLKTKADFDPLEYFNSRDLNLKGETDIQEKYISRALDILEGNESDKTVEEEIESYYSGLDEYYKELNKKQKDGYNEIIKKYQGTGEYEKAEKELAKLYDKESLEEVGDDKIDLIIKFYHDMEQETEQKQAKNSIETERKDNIFMAVMDELKDFILGVVGNECDKDKDKDKVENEDKRKIIDEIGGILKGKVDEEVWRTVIGKLEKVAYNPSETDKADNKAKNEDEKDKEKEKEKEEKYEKEKEIADVDNKCGKAKNSMDKAREIVFGGSQPEFKPSYVSREDRLKLGDNY